MQRDIHVAGKTPSFSCNDTIHTKRYLANNVSVLKCLRQISASYLVFDSLYFNFFIGELKTKYVF